MEKSDVMEKFEFTQNQHEFERMRAIWENVIESFKIIFQISQMGGEGGYNKLKWLCRKSKFRKLTPLTITVGRVRFLGLPEILS